MSVWSSATGYIKIRKENRVSIKKVIEDTLTDESSLHIETTEYNGIYNHKVELTFCLDGFEFCRAKERFFEALRAEEIDLTFELRFLA